MATGVRRYGKQELFVGIGPEGQARLAKSRVLIAGGGATGGTVAALLVRAGVGGIRVVDRDFLELTNLTRQLLYDETDLARGLPKADLAEKKLKAMNSEIEIEAVAADLNPDNILDLTAGMDLILDGLDNQETRYLINDAAVKLGLPWVWSGCLGSTGNVMVVLSGRTPCLRCLFPDPAPPGTLPTCDTAGIIGPTPTITGSIVATEAMKLLSGAGPDRLPGMLIFDLWANCYEVVEINPTPKDDCPCCGRKQFDFLEGRMWSRTATLCGIDAVQVSPPAATRLDLNALAARLDPETIISSNRALLRFEAEGRYFSVFPDGRVIIHGTEDHGLAKALYDRYIGF